MKKLGITLDKTPEVYPPHNPAGTIGSFIGVENSSPNNISAIVLIILLMSLLIVLAYDIYVGKELSLVLAYLKAISPIITLILGFLFGTNRSS